MEQLQIVTEENQKLKEQLQGAFLELGNKREERQLEWNKAVLDNQLEQAKLQLEAQKAGADIANDAQKLDIESQKVAMEAQDKLEETIDSTNGMIGGI